MEIPVEPVVKTEWKDVVPFGRVPPEVQIPGDFHILAENRGTMKRIAYAPELRVLLKANPEGLTLNQMIRAHKSLNLKAETVRQALERMPDVYIDRWRDKVSGQWQAVWCIMPTPEDAPYPTKRFQVSFEKVLNKENMNPKDNRRLLSAASRGGRILRTEMNGRWFESPILDLTNNVPQRLHPDDEETSYGPVSQRIRRWARTGADPRSITIINRLVWAVIASYSKEGILPVLSEHKSLLLLFIAEAINEEFGL